MFWYRWPSWPTEILSGIVVAALVQVLPFLSWKIVVALWLSWVYETFLDPNAGQPGHKPLTDYTQRAVGIALGLWLWSWLL